MVSLNGDFTTTEEAVALTALLHRVTREVRERVGTPEERLLMDVLGAPASVRIACDRCGAHRFIAWWGGTVHVVACGVCAYDGWHVVPPTPRAV